MPCRARATGSRSRWRSGALNEAGGVLGEPVALIAVDDACGLERSVEAAHELVAAGVGDGGRPHVLAFLAARGRRLRDRRRPDDLAVLDPSAPDRGGPPQRLSPERARRPAGRGSPAISWRATGRARRSRSCTTAAPMARAWRARPAGGCGRTACARRSTTSMRRARPTTRRWRRASQAAAIEVLYVGGYGPDAARILRAVRARGETSSWSAATGSGWTSSGPSPGGSARAPCSARGPARPRCRPRRR